MQLRRATPADIPSLRKLEQNAATAAHWTAAQYDELFSPGGASRIALIAEEGTNNEAICGFLIARCLSDEWEIENVIVEQQQRQRGIGASLVRELLAQALAAGAVSVILEVRESNVSALRLYESIGFKAEGRRSAYYRDPVEDALLYHISIAVL